MPLINKQPFTPNPIPENVGPDEDVFYHELTNEIFLSHDEFFDRFLFCNSLIWTCGRTGKSGLTFKEALDSEQHEPGVKKKKVKREREPSDAVKSGEKSETEQTGEPVKKKKKKYPYDPKKYAMPVPEGFDPSLLTPTGKIDGRKLKSKKNKQLAEELLLTSQAQQANSETSPGKRGKKKKEDDVKRKEEEAKKKEDEVKKKAQIQAELAKERELEAKRKKEAAALVKQLERQKREEERKKAAAFLQNWEKKCEDLERDDLKRLPQPTPLCCDLPDRLFGDALFIMESLYNLHEVYEFPAIYPEGLSFDTLEEILFDKQEGGPIGVLIQFLLKTIIDTQPTSKGYGLDDDPSRVVDGSGQAQGNAENKTSILDESTDIEDEDNQGTNHIDRTSEGDEDDDEESGDKEVKMNDLIGAAIKAAREVRLSLSKPLGEMELSATSVTEVLRLHLLQSGSFPKGRTIYNGWYSSREDPGLWLCMQEPDLIKKMSEVSIYGLDVDERIKILHTLIYQLFTFIRTRLYIESASEQLTEIRKTIRKEAADFARWDRENCVKKMQPPKKKGDASNQQQLTETNNSSKSNGHSDLNSGVKHELGQGSHPSSINGDTESDHLSVNIKSESNGQHQLKSCLKTNGVSDNSGVNVGSMNENSDSKKKISFKTQSSNGAIDGQDGSQKVKLEAEIGDNGHHGDDSEQSYEELERAYQQNLVDYEDYQRERAIRYEQLNQTLVELRSNLRMNQSVYGIHPIGRDRAYRRYWLFQSMPGLFVEQDDDCVGKCLPNPTPLESMYKKLFNKDNPLMQQNEADLIRAKTCDASTNSANPPSQDERQQLEQREKKETTTTNDHDEEDDVKSPQSTQQIDDGGDHKEDDEESNRNNHNESSDRRDGEQSHSDDRDDQHDGPEPCVITDEMNICTGDESTCAIHGQKRLTSPRWWFYHTPEAIDQLIESLNRRGHRESELYEVLTNESSIIKPKVSECPAFKLNKYILEQSGIRRSRRLRTKGSKRRGRHYDQD